MGQVPAVASGAGREVLPCDPRPGGALAKRGSNRRAKLKARHARLHARNTDARRDWVEKVSTEIARGYDLIRIEDLDVAA